VTQHESNRSQNRPPTSPPPSRRFVVFSSACKEAVLKKGVKESLQEERARNRPPLALAEEAKLFIHFGWYTETCGFINKRKHPKYCKVVDSRTRGRRRRRRRRRSREASRLVWPSACAILLPTILMNNKTTEHCNAPLK